MKNLLNPKLTNQERQELLLQSIDKENQQKLKQHQQKDPNAFCFRSHWKVNRDDVLLFNQGALNLKSFFDFHPDQLKNIDPELDIILLEGERVEIGEWDQTYDRWCANPYQRVLVVNINAKFYGFHPEKQGFLLAIYERTDGREWMYPASWNQDSTPKQSFSLGLLDIPLHMIERYEAQRTYQDLWCLYDVYNQTRSILIKKQHQAQTRHQKRNTYKKSTRGVQSFTKSLKGGFGL